MGSTDVDTIRDQYSYVDGRGLTADEIQVAVAPTLLAEEKYQQLYLCEVEILGQSKLVLKCYCNLLALGGSFLLIPPPHQFNSPQLGGQVKSSLN